MLLNILATLLLGGLAGWIASILMRTDAQQGIVLNVAVGIAGACLGSLILYRGDIGRPLSLEWLVVAVAGAALLLAMINLFLRGRLR